MRFQTPLVPATLIRRYKRFLADARLSDGREVTAHCANPGAMTGMAEPGMQIWLEPNDDPKRKLRYSWKLLELPRDHWAGVDTGLPNALVAEALSDGRIAELSAYGTVRREVRYGEKSRVDFLLSNPGLPDAYVEVKTVTLRRHGDLAEFPDSVTKRGARHLVELAGMTRQGQRAVLLYVVHRSDCARVGVAADIDPEYARAFDAARLAGVEVIAYGTEISTEGVRIGTPLPAPV